MITNPLKMATIFNNYFRKKVEILRERTNKPPEIPPTENGFKTDIPTNPPKLRPDLYVIFPPSFCFKFQSQAYSCAEL